MNKNIVVITAVLILVLGIGAYAYMQQKKSTDSPALNQNTVSTNATSTTSEVTGSTATTSATIGGTVVTPTEPKNETTPKEATFTMAEVATHNTAASCYAIVKGVVYDLTSWISKHPGGDSAIKGMCGRDGTEAFAKQHKGAPKQDAILETFKIGTLAN